jgi:hypothetical protein
MNGFGTILPKIIVKRLMTAYRNSDDFQRAAG